VPGERVAPRGAAAGAPYRWGPITDWGVLRERVAGCMACDLCKTRTQTVFGVGNTRAEWLIVGEAPGAEEDRQGEPFVGAPVNCSMPCCWPSGCRAKPCSSPTSSSAVRPAIAIRSRKRCRAACRSCRHRSRC
jgi:hypothetical protein